MMAAQEEMPLSELLHRPGAAAERLKVVRALRLRRRDADDLALIRADQMQREAVVVDFTARLLAGLIRTGGAAGPLDNLAPIAVLLTQWRHTAEIYSDPMLLEIISLEPLVVPTSSHIGVTSSLGQRLSGKSGYRRPQ